MFAQVILNQSADETAFYNNFPVVKPISWKCCRNRKLTPSEVKAILTKPRYSIYELPMTLHHPSSWAAEKVKEPSSTKTSGLTSTLR